MKNELYQAAEAPQLQLEKIPYQVAVASNENVGIGNIAQWPYQITSPEGGVCQSTDMRRHRQARSQNSDKDQLVDRRPHWTERSDPLKALAMAQAFPSLLPRKLHCADYFEDGLVIRSKASALKRRHIQLNLPNSYASISFDVDWPGAYFAADDGNVLRPTFIAENPQNGHACISYMLKTPVLNFAGSRSSPLHFYAAIERGLRRRLGADPNYRGFIAKNPLHPDWRVEWQAPEPYELGQLADWLFPNDMRPDLKRERTGASRNCDVFDDTREWAYRNVLEFKRNGASLEAWTERCRKIAGGHNLIFDHPLAPSEIRSIGKSIAKWTWRKFSEGQFSRIQSFRGARGATKRWAGHTAAQATKPWLAEGISRRTWYYRRAKAKQGRAA